MEPHITLGKVYGWSKLKTFRFLKILKYFSQTLPLCFYKTYPWDFSPCLYLFLFGQLEGRLYKHIISRGVNLEFMYLTKRLGSTNNISVFLGYILYPDFVFIRSNLFMYFYIRCVQIVKQKCSRGFLCHIYAFRKKIDRSL